MAFPNPLFSLSLMIIAAAAAEILYEPPPRNSGPASASAQAYFQQLCHVSISYLARAWAVIRQKYQRTLRGQLGFVDMVQLIALCSVVQGLRLWRKRSPSQQEQAGTSNAGHVERKAGGSTKASSRVSVGSLRLGES